MNFATDLITKGWLSDSRQLIVKGWLVDITVEELPSYPPDYTSGGGSFPRTIKKDKKLIKITVRYNNKVFSELKEVDKDLTIKASDIDVEINKNKKPIIKVRVL